MTLCTAVIRELPCQPHHRLQTACMPSVGVCVDEVQLSGHIRTHRISCYPLNLPKLSVPTCGMRAVTSRKTTYSASGVKLMAHKIDLGFHRHNLLVTAKPAGSDSCSQQRTSSGTLLAQSDYSMSTCTVRTPRGSEVVMRCLPAEDNGAFDPAAAGSRGVDGPLDLSGTQASDAIIGDDYSNIDDDAAHQRLSGLGADHSQAGSVRVDSIGQPPATSDHSGSSGSNSEQSGRLVTPSAPADDPAEIKHIVQEETTGITDN